MTNVMGGLAEREVSLVAWAKLRDVSVDASAVGGALLSLLSAECPEAASDAYWLLENRVVVQGSVFETAERVTAVLVAALAQPRALHVRVSILELLFQILSGEPDKSERERGAADLVERCRLRAREGLWVLLTEFTSGASDAAADVLRLIDGDHFRGFSDDHPQSGDL